MGFGVKSRVSGHRTAIALAATGLLLLLPAMVAASWCSYPCTCSPCRALPCPPGCLPACLQAVVEAEGKTKLAEREVQRLRAQLRALGSRDDA